MSDKITPEQLRKEAVAVERMHGETLTGDWRTKQANQLRALSLLAAAEANDGATPETGALPHSDDKPIKEAAMARILCRRLERERNGLAAEVLRLIDDLFREKVQRATEKMT